MDRLLLQRSLVAISGLALVMAASGCRDRNLRVPPPAHYSDGGAVPEAAAYPGYAPPSLDPAMIDPYSGASYGGDANSYDPAATPASGSYDPAAASYGSAPSQVSTYPYSDPAADYGVAPPAEPAQLGFDPASGAVYASPSSPVTAPASLDHEFSTLPGIPGIDSSTGAPDEAIPYAPATPVEIPGIDDGVLAPPIPDDLPAIP